MRRKGRRESDMTDGAETPDTEALVETGGELFERIRRGEDVEADLRAWSKQVDRITGRQSARVLSHLERACVRLQIKIKVLIRAKAEPHP